MSEPKSVPMESMATIKPERTVLNSHESGLPASVHWAKRSLKSSCGSRGQLVALALRRVEEAHVPSRGSRRFDLRAVAAARQQLVHAQPFPSSKGGVAARSPVS